jgi:hypothetical protein
MTDETVDFEQLITSAEKCFSCDKQNCSPKCQFFESKMRLENAATEVSNMEMYVDCSFPRGSTNG